MSRRENNSQIRKKTNFWGSHWHHQNTSIISLISHNKNLKHFLAYYFKVKIKMLPTVVDGNGCSQCVLSGSLAIALEMCLTLDSDRPLEEFRNLSKGNKDV